MPDATATLDHRPAEASSPRFARPRPFAVLLLVTGIIGWVASAVLVAERLALFRDPEHVTSCDINPWVSCGKVMGSWQSELFGFPNPLIGIVAFAVIITTAMAVLAGAQLGRWYWIGLQVAVSLGTVFVIWLWSQALFSLYLVHGIIPAPAGLVRFTADWAWTLVALIYIAVAASVYLRFFPAFTSPL